MNEVDYFADEQWGHDYDELCKALIALNEGRNLDCWPLGSFGWKDADLYPTGCTGIEEIVKLDDLRITLKIGGHKTFCPYEDYDDTFSEEQLDIVRDAEQDLINDIPYGGYWSGDDWIISFEEEIYVPWVMNEETAFPEYELTAQKIVSAAKEKCFQFENCMEEYSKYFEEILL